MVNFNIPPDLASFITFLATPVFGAWFVSQFLETSTWFQALESGAKTRLVMAIYIVLGLLSYGLTQWATPLVIAQWQPLYSVIIGALAAFASGQAYHDQVHKTQTPTEANKVSVSVSAESTAPSIDDISDRSVP